MKGADEVETWPAVGAKLSRRKARLGVLAAFATLAPAPAPAAAMTNDGKPGVCPQGQIWDFHNSVCMAVEEIHVTGSGPRAPYTPKLPPLGYRPPRSVGVDGPRGGGGQGGRPGSSGKAIEGKKPASTQPSSRLPARREHAAGLDLRCKELAEGLDRYREEKAEVRSDELGALGQVWWLITHVRPHRYKDWMAEWMEIDCRQRLART